jgi:biopolymer transport protein ExbD
MGISAGASGKGPKSILNVTPLVDVVLVLLVIFMVTMPAMMRAIPVAIPQDAPPAALPTTPPVQVKAMVDGTIEIIDGANAPQIVQRTQFASVLRARLQHDIDSSKTVFVDFETGMPWDQVASVMDTISGIGKTASTNTDSMVTIAITKHPAGDAL